MSFALAFISHRTQKLALRRTNVKYSMTSTIMPRSFHEMMNDDQFSG